MQSASAAFLAPRRQHLWVLLFGIVAIVLGPFFVQRMLHRVSYEAAAQLTQAREVEATAHAAVSAVRNAESAALALAHGLDTPLVRQRLEEGSRQALVNLAALEQLTRDRPGQQVRLGKLRDRAERKIEAVQRIAAARAPGDVREAVRELVTGAVIHHVAEEIILNERQAAAIDAAEAAALRTRATYLTAAVAFMQLLTLVLATVLWRRETGRRLNFERQAREAGERADAILQAVREPIVLVDREQAVVLANRAFCDLYGATPDDVRGQLLPDVGAGAWADPVLAQRLRDVLGRDRELWDHELVQTTADGVRRNMVVNAVRMLQPSGESLALITATDLTAHKAAEARAGELNRQLEAKVAQVSEVNRELEAFSYSVSHDLRAPLRHIAGFADKLTRHLGEQADPKALHYLGVIGGSAQRMGVLIDDLLVYSRLGRNAMRLQPVDMQSLVEETRAMLDATRANDAPDTPAVEWRIAPLPVVIADENMIRQVWQNLLGNAVKYSAGKPSPVVEVTHERTPEGDHCFTVRDNGAGFDMAYASKLFGVFQRMHKASEYPGTGIGLASVRRVVTRHQGRVWAEAAPDQGATFHFTMPTMLDMPAATKDSDR